MGSHSWQRMYAERGLAHTHGMNLVHVSSTMTSRFTLPRLLAHTRTAALNIVYNSNPIYSRVHRAQYLPSHRTAFCMHTRATRRFSAPTTDAPRRVLEDLDCCAYVRPALQLFKLRLALHACMYGNNMYIYYTRY
jgi:hypothetical protein